METKAKDTATTRDTPGAVPQEESKLRKDTTDVVGGARQVDQLEKLHPQAAEQKSNRSQIGSPPAANVDDGGSADPVQE